jgi:hypothetical protein
LHLCSLGFDKDCVIGRDSDEITDTFSVIWMDLITVGVIRAHHHDPIAEEISPSRNHSFALFGMEILR